MKKSAAKLEKSAAPAKVVKREPVAAPAAELRKGEDVEPEGDEPEVEDDDAEKSLTGTDLEKSIAKLESFTEENDTVTRKDALLTKAQTGEKLSKSESAELLTLLGGEEPVASTLGEEVSKGLKENDTLQKAYDVSEYLREQQDELCKSLDALSTHIEKSDARQHGFNLLLAKAVADTGNLVKALGEKLESIAAQPARGPKSVVKPGQVMQKSFSGQAAQGDGEKLSKSEVLDTLDQMMEKSMAEGRGGAANNGEDLLQAISKYEQLTRITPGLLTEVQAFRKNRGGAVAH